MEVIPRTRSCPVGETVSPRGTQTGGILSDWVWSGRWSTTGLVGVAGGANDCVGDCAGDRAWSDGVAVAGRWLGSAGVFPLLVGWLVRDAAEQLFHAAQKLVDVEGF